jgi:hypothetical protein
VHTYVARREHNAICLVIALSADLGFLVEDGGVVNAYAHADAKGTILYLIVNNVFQAWYLE